MSGLPSSIGCGYPLPRIDGERVMRHQGELLLNFAVLYRHLWHSFGAWQSAWLASVYSR